MKTTQTVNGSKVGWSSIVPVLAGLAIASIGGWAGLLGLHGKQPHVGAVRSEQFMQVTSMIQSQLAEIKDDVREIRKMLPQPK